MKTFRQYLSEMAGTYAVSPKPGADYQIWGAPGGLGDKSIKGDPIKHWSPKKKKKHGKQ